MRGLQQDRRLARLSTYHVRSVGQAPFQGRGLLVGFFGVWGLGFRGWGLGFKGLGFRVLGFRV